MIILQYFDGAQWVYCGKFVTEQAAWKSLGEDNENYRTVDEKGKILTDKSNADK